MNKKPLLSVCIPTYNRADVLALCLESIVTNEAFGDDVEVVISNNCSTDETEEVCLKYARIFSNIKYFKNETNIGGDRNILRVLELGSGTFLKLNNDYCSFKKHGLKFLLDVIRRHSNEKPVLYFHNEIGKGNTYETRDFNDFFLQEKIGLGWISNYGYWKSDFDKFEDKDKFIETKFQQFDWLVRSYKKKNHIYCYNTRFYNRNKFKAKAGGYHFTRVHSVNFFVQPEILEKEHIITSESLEIVKKYVAYFVMWHQFRFSYIDRKHYSFETENGWEIIKQQFGHFKWYKKTLVKTIIFASIKTPYEKIVSLIRDLRSRSF